VEKTSYAPGTPSWIDLGTPDLAGATAFYSALFGWEIVDQGPEAGGYCMAEIGGKPVAGLGNAQQPGPPYWTTYITVESADAAVDKVKSAGGQVLVEAFDIFDSGRMAVFMDPTGAVFSVWQPVKHTGAALVNEPGTLIWNELTTREPDKARAFYTEVFGWAAEDDPAAGPTYTQWTLDSESIGGMIVMDDKWPSEVPSHWMVYFNVANAEQSVARVTELGGAVVVPPFPAGPGICAVVQDPQGASFSLIEVTVQM
jgi:predicted enzyme related to lactoylglutathione lyase